MFRLIDETTWLTEAVARRCSVKKVFLEILQNSQENTCNFTKKETLAQVFPGEFCEISKNIFSYRIPPVAASWLKRFHPFHVNVFTHFSTFQYPAAFAVRDHLQISLLILSKFKGIT